MAGASNPGYRGPMIHIRLDPNTHKQLKVLVAKQETTMQKLVSDVVRREVQR